MSIETVDLDPPVDVGARCEYCRIEIVATQMVVEEGVRYFTFVHKPDLQAECFPVMHAKPFAVDRVAHRTWVAYSSRCGDSADHERHEWYDGGLRKDCPGRPETAAAPAAF